MVTDPSLKREYSQSRDFFMLSDLLILSSLPSFFAVVSAPSGPSSAAPGNAFGAFSKPVTTTATPAPSVQTTQSLPKPSQPVQPDQPKGPPNVTAPGGLGGFGQQGLFGKGPPNAVAPGMSGAQSQGQPSGPALVSSSALASGTSHPAQLGSVPGVPAPVAGSAPQGAASINSKFTVPQTAAAGPSLSVAPASMAAGASTRSASASFGPPNTVAPDQGLSSFNEAKHSRDQPDARVAVGMPVGAVQQTPKASGDAIDPTRISATSTPAASAKPVTAALLSNIKEEVSI